jgi:4-deoxy-L-threo-5-hexosulose-uronate ketol-isomerase
VTDDVVRPSMSPAEFRGASPAAVRAALVAPALLRPGQPAWVYTLSDRLLIGGAVASSPVTLTPPAALGAKYLLERRELGIANVGESPGTVTADGVAYELGPLDFLYIGRGTESVAVAAVDPARPARFYFVSTPADTAYPTVPVPITAAERNTVGDGRAASVRTLYKWTGADGPRTAELQMGVTVLAEGSVWNTLPPHLHIRRTEVYFYFRLGPEGRVFHFLGEPDDPRPVLVANETAVIAPPWSIHMGVGTEPYAFVWAMGGENNVYQDLDPVPVTRLG